MGTYTYYYCDICYKELKECGKKLTIDDLEDFLPYCKYCGNDICEIHGHIENKNDWECICNECWDRKIKEILILE